MSLKVDVEVIRGDFVLDAELEVTPGETLALLGPNGSGKSTLLATIAGLLAPHQGTVTVNGRTLTEADASGRYRATPPHQRRVGLLGQDPLLFPHLSAFENVAFGLRSAGVKAADARTKAREWLVDVGLGEPDGQGEQGSLRGLGERRPAELSGGQQQRVAIARVLAVEPDVLLLDEPMAALDVENASLLRALLRDRLSQSKIATIVVTHDVVDALVLADRVAILDNGRIIDSGEAKVVLGQPVNRFAAKLAGLNLIQSVSEVGEVECRAFPPTAVRVAAAPPATDTATEATWLATVAQLESAVRGVRVTFAGESVVAELSAAEMLASGIREGTEVALSVDPAFVTAYPARISCTDAQK